MILKSDIVNCYRYLLGREPSEKEVDGWFDVFQNKNVDELIHEFYRAPEFLLKCQKNMVENIAVFRDSYQMKTSIGNILQQKFSALEVCAKLANFENSGGGGTRIFNK